jgi:hypothetical protein
MAFGIDFNNGGNKHGEENRSEIGKNEWVHVSI